MIDKQDTIKKLNDLIDLYDLVEENKFKIMNFSCYNTYEIYQKNLACEIDVLRVLINEDMNRPRLN